MKIEKVKFERTGGFTGIRIAAEIEMDDLPEDQKSEIQELFDDMDIEELSKKLTGNAPFPDGFVYSVIVESEERKYQFTMGESALPDNMGPLIEILEAIAKRQMRRKKD
jgi:hypothetical protein